jgi:hypothetical protein
MTTGLPLHPQIVSDLPDPADSKETECHDHLRKESCLLPEKAQWLLQRIVESFHRLDEAHHARAYADFLRRRGDVEVKEGRDVSEGMTGQPETELAGLDRYVRDPRETQLLSKVREGMRVIDANGEELGKVELVKMGDPEAVSVRPVAVQDCLGLREALGGGAEPHVPEPFFSHLLRLGFVKIDGRGWIDTDYYVTPDMIQSISGNTVSLKKTRDHVITEI